MDFNDLAKLIKERRSIREWQDKPVSEDLIKQAIHLATWAPNGGNQQNWKFYLIMSRETIGAIADAVKASTEMIASWPEAAQMGDALVRSREKAGFFRKAPAAVAVAASKYQSDVDEVLSTREKGDPLAKQMRGWRNAADSKIQSVAAAISYLLLILHQMGLGAVWMTGPLQAKGDIERILKVPPELDIVAFIPLGYPAENPAPKGRRPLSEKLEVIR